MADDASHSAPPGERSPLDDLEDDSFSEGENPFGGEGNPFTTDDPMAEGAFGNESPAVMMAKLWIRQNALLAVGSAFAAGALIGALKK
jgi:hypothetical protein